MGGDVHHLSAEIRRAARPEGHAGSDHGERRRSRVESELAMVPNGKVEFVWGDGDHTFNIAKAAQVLELEEKCGCGVREILKRLSEDRWGFNDFRETIRLA